MMKNKNIAILKTDNSKHLVFGWASVSITVDGVQLQDRQHDIIDPDDLEDAAYEYVLQFRDTGEEHIKGLRKKGKLVESCVFTEEKQRAIGIPAGCVPVGRWIGFHIDDDEAWEKIKNGTYRMFSVEGRAVREPTVKGIAKTFKQAMSRFDDIEEVALQPIAKTFDEISGTSCRKGNINKNTDSSLADLIHQKDCTIAKNVVSCKQYDEIVEVEKFNPYHDSKGRFASANGYASFTFRTKDPSKQHLADAAVAREKDKDAKRREAETSEAETNTIAGVKRGEPMTFEKADSGSVNPHYGEAKGYSTNCQSCVVVFEARQRGYDVSTLPYKDNPASASGVIARRTNMAWINPVTGNHPEHIENAAANTPKRYESFMENTVKKGERYTLEFAWKGRNKGAHIVNLDRNEKGELRIKDNQRGAREKSEWVGEKEIRTYLSRVKFTQNIYGYKISCGPKMLRIDNMEFDDFIVNGISEARK